ncbi:hypothetical protein ORJ04_22025 [Rheinheimera baltica]|uniref:Uncharacterized protein n=1 Tax=Rheinheimera baltica TaxID=67576 RepID=A0ABT9I5H0_9GAMM|nr:hypothetical protein [Rheinheimera baltica]MDP5138629.1 hypothetical protein [Rheinheimera baltica]MDP5148849.1 hypothetical protein [Rheinheimera baltica]
MELKDFIKEAIKDISEAITESNSELQEHGVIVNPRRVELEKKDRSNLLGYIVSPFENPDPNFLRPVHMLSFDISVTAATKQNGKEGIGVNVAGIKLGKETDKINSNDSASRIVFSIPIALPVSEK